MAKFIEFPLESGGRIVIETVEEASKGAAGFGRGEVQPEALETAKQSFDQSVESVRQSTDLLVSGLHSLGTPPDEMEVSFYLKAAGEAGGLAVSKSGQDANYSITLRWRREEKKDGEKQSEQAEDKAAA